MTTLLQSIEIFNILIANYQGFAFPLINNSNIFFYKIAF